MTPPSWISLYPSVRSGAAENHQVEVEIHYRCGRLSRGARTEVFTWRLGTSRVAAILRWTGFNVRNTNGGLKSETAW